MGAPPKNQGEIDAGNEYAAFVKGWTVGARAGAPDPRAVEHDNKRIANSYNDGYSKGVADRNAAQRMASLRSWYSPSPMRDANIPGRGLEAAPFDRHVFLVGSTGLCLHCEQDESHPLHEIGP